MRFISNLFVITLLSVVTISCQNSNAKSITTANGNVLMGSAPKYVFYFIGDGMAAPQVQLGDAALKSSAFRENYANLTSLTDKRESLYIKTLNITGLATTHADNRYITDSAAAGTALATGSKTDVGYISQLPSGDNIKTIAERAKEKGMKVGIVSSVSIDHATPACFYAHEPSRSNYANISSQVLTSGFDYFAGGSPRWDSRASSEDSNNAKAYADFKQSAEKIGFKYVTKKAEFDAIGSGETSPVIATLDMLANRQYSGDGFSLPYTIDLAKQSSDDNKISLAQFTQKGIDLLYGEAGFFMMVEGGKIDWVCHANDAASIAYEVVAFDEAIGVALKFAAEHPDETLIVVTGDHDCGGLSIGFGGTGYTTAFELLANAKSSYLEFSNRVSRRIKSGDSFEKLLDYACQQYGFTYDKVTSKDATYISSTELSNYEIEKLRTAYNDAKSPSKREAKRIAIDYGGYNPFTVACIHLLNNKAGIGFSSFTHTAVPVMVFAHGAREDIFSGYYDNTDIAKKIIDAAEL
ncbi:MAG: alkaline phosphatase [Rikenellaceae bacterium]